MRHWEVWETIEFNSELPELTINLLSLYLLQEKQGES